MDLKTLGEFGLIEKLAANLKNRGGVRLSIGDDGAVLDSLHTPLVTTDCLVEGVHFRCDWTSAKSLGKKCIAVNVSDVAAMGGKPIAAFVSLALSTHDDVHFLAELYAGMEAACADYGLTLAGGDTARSRGGLFISIALVGDVLSTQRGPVLRENCKNGDAMLVTGTLGDAAAGLQLLQSPPESALPLSTHEFLLQRHHAPTARLREMQAALECAPDSIHASLDLSDGLAGDAAHIARASAVSLSIETARLPLSKQCRQAARVLGEDALHWAFSGGEDYELLLCVEACDAEKIARAISEKTGTPVTRIGTARADGQPRVLLRDEKGDEREAGKAFTHF